MSLFGAFWDKDPNPVGESQFGNNKGLFFNLNWYPKGVVHIGAWDAWEAKQYAHYCGGNSIFVEANPNSFNRFRQEIEKFGQRVFNFAAYDVDDLDMDLYCPVGREDSSSLLPQRGNVVKVKTLRMDTFFQRENLSFDDYDLLNIDTEGVELKVLQGIGVNIKKFTYIIVEVSDIGSESDKQVNDYILTQGFEFVRDSTKHPNQQNGKIFCDKLYKKISA